MLNEYFSNRIKAVELFAGASAGTDASVLSEQHHYGETHNKTVLTNGQGERSYSIDQDNSWDVGTFYQPVKCG